MTYDFITKTNRKELEKLHKQILVCKKCPLYKTRTKAVPGEGPDNAKIMFIGEAPGKNEDLQGRPFVGSAGTFLDELLQSINLKRKKVFITSVIKCRPPKNRLPKSSEVKICILFYLFKQIELIKPKIICTLGDLALKTLLGRKCLIIKIHGKIIKKNKIIHFPMFHPAAALRNPKIKQIMKKDMRKLKNPFPF